VPKLSDHEVEELIEEVSIVFCTPSSLMLGKGGIRDTEVALGRRVCWWVLKRRGLSLAEIGKIFSRRWDTIWSGVRAVEQQLTNLCPPEWSVDIYPLAGITFEQSLKWALRSTGEAEDGPIFAYCVGSLGPASGRNSSGLPAGLQLEGLRRLAATPRLRRGVLWVFHSILDSTPEYSIKYQAEKMGYPYSE
jgi:hypothetical protein